MSDRFRNLIIGQAPRLRVSEARSSLECQKTEGIADQRFAAGGLTSAFGAPSRVHSRGMANEPNSEWRRLRVSTPETLLTFRTTNR